MNGIQLSDGIFGLGVVISPDGSASGDLHAILSGADLLNLPVSVTVNGWITAGTANGDGTMTLRGMADGVPLAAVAGASGVQLTLGASALPSLAVTDGSVLVE